VSEETTQPRDDVTPAANQKPSRPPRGPTRPRTEASGPGKSVAEKKAPQPQRKSPSTSAKASAAGRKGATADFRAATSGDKIAGYRIEEQIGEGGMAVVYRARDERLGRHVALKLLAPALAADEGFRHRFIRESRSAAAVDHPNIIPIYEAGDASGVLFIAMRYIRGGDVRSLLERERPLSGARTWAIISQVAAALDAAHARGLIHRDVKPANMLLDARSGTAGEDRSRRPGDQAQHVYLSDFGISKQPLTASNLTMTGQFVGTLDYIAPEQIDGTSVDGRADLYSLGCAAYELLSGTPPFRLSKGLALVRAHLSETPPSIVAERRDLPADVDAVLAGAMAKSPHERYATCAQFAANLGRAIGLVSGQPDLPSTPQLWSATELAGVPQPGASPAPGVSSGGPYYALPPQGQPGAPSPAPGPDQVTVAPAGPVPVVMRRGQQDLAGRRDPITPGGPWGPGGSDWPAQPPRRRSRGKIAGVVAVIAAAAAAAVVAVVLIGHGNPFRQLNDVRPTSTSSAPSPATSQSAEASAVSGLLASGNGSAANLNNAVNDVAACGALSSDVQQIQQVENQRQIEYNQAQSTQTSSLPSGAALKSDLVNALYYSLQADQAYRAYADQVQQSGCHSGSQASALADGGHAVTYKDMFLILWNPIATGYGLPTVTQGNI
jgi:serine/threonine-protein kinase